VPRARARRHPGRLAREVALWSAPGWAALLLGAAAGWWPWPAVPAGGLVTAVVAMPLAVARRRFIEELCELVDSWPEGLEREPPTRGGWIVDPLFVTRLWRFFRWLKQRDERDAAEEALQERLMEVLPDPLLQVNPKGRVVYANRAAFERLGGELLERPLSRIIRDPDVLGAVTTALDADLASQLTIAEPRARGRRFQVEVLPVRIPGEPPRVVLVLRERTSEHLSQRMMSDFVANASHEIRTPLTAVRGLIETLRGAARDDPKASARFLATMASEAERMNRLVDELMTLSQVELMERDRPRRPVDVGDLLQAVRTSQDARAAEVGVTLVVDAPEPLPEIPGDPDQLHQVLANLVDNALKYGAGGERVELRARHHAAAPPRAGRLAGLAVVALEVVDQGEGIPPEAVPRLTERFFRVDTSRSRRLGGTGLGLAIVKHIVSRHRGHLAVESVLGEGSRFTVFLALDPEA
jgi:two-component system phosphate regulon sensor histidine kinase PhoR